MVENLYPEIVYVKAPYSEDLVRIIFAVNDEQKTVRNSTLNNLAKMGWTLITEEGAKQLYPEQYESFIKVV
jgi:hypothetical protein